MPIREFNGSNTVKKLKKAQLRADLVEVWLDKLSSADIQKVIKLAKKPLIGVCRSAGEKGSFRGEEGERIQVLINSAEAGFEYIDCGLNTQIALIKKLSAKCKKSKTKLIISAHFWDETPNLDDLLEMAKKAQNLGADIIKIAAYVKNWSDNTILFEFVRILKKRKVRSIVVGMGEKGKLSRIGCPLLGSFLTYIALDEKSKTAPGQLTFAQSNMRR